MAAANRPMRMLARKLLPKRNGYLFTFVSQEDKKLATSDLMEPTNTRLFFLDWSKTVNRRLEASAKAPLRLQRVHLLNPLLRHQTPARRLAHHDLDRLTPI
ncbi:hypothetical protein [Dyella mobilis]|uniref:Uncharacterized protein n=1 Tax=Dyella mobilis TaxID=1849582 RepID=A0ABS2KGH6_9GAMM|nr:hypothetical protein [Dyella mobilis]MBM7130199.1 hypothetical protein [Dyella mobilis]